MFPWGHRRWNNRDHPALLAGGPPGSPGIGSSDLKRSFKVCHLSPLNSRQNLTRAICMLTPLIGIVNILHRQLVTNSQGPVALGDRDDPRGGEADVPCFESVLLAVEARRGRVAEGR